MKPSIVIALTQMWESFSFFGMRVLLVLYLVSGEGYDPASAVILYTLYIALVKVVAGGGGVFVDRFLGYKQAVVIGGIFILIGHLFLTFSNLFFLGLGSIVVGSALFRVSLQTLLGLVNDPKGFTIFYVGMNLGGLSAAILCGITAQIYGWHVGFGLAALGMVFGLILFLSKMHLFNGFGGPRPIMSTLVIMPIGIVAILGIGYLLFKFAFVHTLALPFGLIALSVLLKRGGKELIFSLFLLIGFAAVEELWGSFLMLFSETHVDRTILGFTLPSSVIAAINPLVIIFAGPFLARCEMEYRTKLIFGFLSISFAFLFLYGSALMQHPPAWILIIGLSLIAVGEVFIVPTIFSYVAKKAPGSGAMTGATILALAVGSLLSGTIAQIPYDPAVIFLGISCLAIVFSLSIISIDYLRKRGAYTNDQF